MGLQLAQQLKPDLIVLDVQLPDLNGFEVCQQLKPDLIVLDVQLPDLNGFEVCQQLKSAEDTLAIPIIMLTRHDEPAAVANGLQAGVADYIPKDAFADVVLLETLRQMELIKP